MDLSIAQRARYIQLFNPIQRETFHIIPAPSSVTNSESNLRFKEKPTPNIPDQFSANSNKIIERNIAFTC